ncbi:ATP-binding protein [Streptomyces sp. NPDC059627]
MTPHTSPETRTATWEQPPAPPPIPPRAPAQDVPPHLEHRLRMSWRLPGRSPHAPGEARRRVRAGCRAWNVPAETVDVLTLITSELVTNAVIHVAGDEITVSLLLSARHAWVLVADQGHTRTPAPPHEVPQDAEGGRGLLLVNTLATHYRVDADDRDGTRAWACVQLPDDRTHRPPAPASRCRPEHTHEPRDIQTRK